MGHAFLAPSSAHIWGKPDGCRAFPLMAVMYPQDDSPESLEGDACHEAGELMIQAGLRAQPHDIGPDWIDSQGTRLDDELHQAAELYAGDVLAQARNRGIFGGECLGIERHAPASERIHSENAGTPDAWMYDHKGQRLILWDAKFGYGVVEAVQNWQCINYAILVLDQLGIGGLADQWLKVEFRIVQPRAPHPEGPIRSWTIQASDLRGYANQLAASASECMEPEPTARTGSHCRYCPGRHACTAAQQMAFAGVEESRKLDVQEPDAEGAALELRTLRRAKEAIEHRLTGLEKQAEGMARAGQKLPGLALTPTYGREKWNADNAQVYQLGELFGVDLRQDKPITPKQARDKGIDRDVIKSYSEIPQTGFKLVDDDATLAARVFKPKNGA